jgi:hypothetical protein
MQESMLLPPFLHHPGQTGKFGFIKMLPRGKDSTAQEEKPVRKNHAAQTQHARDYFACITRRKAAEFLEYETLRYTLSQPASYGAIPGGCAFAIKGRTQLELR